MSRRKRQAGNVDPVPFKVLARKGRPCFVVVWTDPRTGRSRQEQILDGEGRGIPAVEKLRQAANRAAASLVAERTSDAFVDGCRIDEFWRRYREEHLSTLSSGSRSMAAAVRSAVETILRPTWLDDLDASAISKLARELRRHGLRARREKRAGGLAETSVAAYLAHLKVALRWAVSVKLLAAVPAFPRNKRVKGHRNHNRRRPITGEELDRLRLAAKKQRPADWKNWSRLLRGLYWSGLRLGEARILSWDFQAPFSIWVEGETWLFRIRADGEKAGQDRLLPIAPEFVAMLKKVPPAKRRGKVFRLGVGRSSVDKILREIGKASGIVVSSTGATVRAHDLRRTFGTRWAKVLMPADLQVLMRHASIETTMGYYVLVDALDLARRLGSAGDGSGDSRLRASDPRIAKERRKS